MTENNPILKEQNVQATTRAARAMFETAPDVIQFQTLEKYSRIA
jgi:hypothetical protein